MCVAGVCWWRQFECAQCARRGQRSASLKPFEHVVTSRPLPGSRLPACARSTRVILACCLVGRHECQASIRHRTADLLAAWRRNWFRESSAKRTWSWWAQAWKPHSTRSASSPQLEASNETRRPRGHNHTCCLLSTRLSTIILHLLLMYFAPNLSTRGARWVQRVEAGCSRRHRARQEHSFCMAKLVVLARMACMLVCLRLLQSATCLESMTLSLNACLFRRPLCSISHPESPPSSGRGC